MKTLIGTCQTHDLTPVMGKLCFPEKGMDAFRGEACLAVLSDSLPLSEESTVVGTILLSDLAVPATYPCPFLRLPSLSSEHHGKIALLDPQSGTLFISPDLSTLDRYAQALCSACLDSPSASRRSWVIHTPEEIARRDADGWLLELTAPPDQNAEEFYYEQYCDAADRAMGTPIAAVVNLAADRAPEQTREQIRALLRGAVYGRFSLLLRGILSPDGLRLGLEEVHRAFCELESEGRECNGYLPRGILIDTPMSLVCELSPMGLDLIALDLPRLLPLLTGSNRSMDERLLQGVLPLLGRMTERYGKQKKIAILSLSDLSNVFCEELRSMETEEIYWQD